MSNQNIHFYAIPIRSLEHESICLFVQRSESQEMSGSNPDLTMDVYSLF